MTATPPRHDCRVIASPWPGVYAVATDSGRHFGRHSHATYGLGLVDAGAQHSASGRGPVQAGAGDLMTTQPGEVHDGRPLGGPSRRWRMVHLPPALLQPLAGSTPVELERPVLQDARLAHAVRRLLARLHAWQAGRTGALACEEALVDAFGQLLARHAVQRPAAGTTAAIARIAPARERLADDVANAPTLTELAALCGLDRYQLLRRFRQACGTTPHAWLLQQRAERARGLIAQGRPLAEAAAGSGFADQSHMTRRFVRQFGFTPGDWQQATGGSRQRTAPAACAVQ